ncbi:MAG TPA: cytochrome c [Oligoflexia bacterium]|mgnify:CR=1 FL=1|nr:cytochrome c [Oligoflexia bacterium]
MKSAWCERLVLVAALGVFAAGCTKNPKKPAFEFMPHMADSPAVKGQERDSDGNGMGVPPEGTVPQGYQPYAHRGDPDAAKGLRNPLRSTKPVLARGKLMFETYCMVCHGRKGEGDGSIVPKFPRPPTLHSEKVRDWSDGQIFHVISDGQNLMPKYASQIAPEDRWAIVHYVRTLQRSLNPTAEDLKAAGGR